MKKLLLILCLGGFSQVALAQQSKDVPAQHSDTKSPGDDIKKRLDELEKRTQEAEKKAAEAEKKAIEAEKRAIEAEKKSAGTKAAPTPTPTPSSTGNQSPGAGSKQTSGTNPTPAGDVKYVKTPDGKTVKMVNGKIVPESTPPAATSPATTSPAPTGDVKYVKTPDGKTVKMVNGKIVPETTNQATTPATSATPPATGDVKYVKTPDGKTVKMVNGKIVPEEGASNSSSENKSAVTGEVKYVKTPDGKVIKMVNGKPVPEAPAANPTTTTTQPVSTNPKEPKLIAPDVGKTMKQPAGAATTTPSATKPTETPVETPLPAAGPTIITRKVDPSRPSNMTITADTDCKIKINGKELAPLKAGVPFAYKGHWGDNTVDAELMDKSDHFSEKIFVDADKFTYMVRFVKPEKLLKFINDNKIDMVKEVLKNNPTVVNPKDEFEFSPLALACEKGKMEIVQLMLDNGADLKLAGNAQCLLNASMNGHTDIARLLIEKGMNINQKFENNWTLLHHATQKGKMDIITLLLEKGVDVTAKNDKGETAKDIAYENGMIELARMLGN